VDEVDVEAPDGKLLDLDTITSSQLAKHVSLVTCIVLVCVCVCMHIYIIYMHHYNVYECLLQLTMVEMSLFKAVDLYEMTVHLWEGNTPSRALKLMIDTVCNNYDPLQNQSDSVAILMLTFRDLMM